MTVILRTQSKNDSLMTAQNPPAEVLSRPTTGQRELRSRVNSSDLLERCTSKSYDLTLPPCQPLHMTSTL